MLYDVYLKRTIIYRVLDLANIYILVLLLRYKDEKYSAFGYYEVYGVIFNN